MCRFRSILVMSFALAISCAAFRFSAAQMDLSDNGPRAVPVQPADDETSQPAAAAGSENLFAILGEVARPGVYRAPFAEPYLADLVANAGGLTDRAAGHLRVIRQTADGVRAEYAEGSEFQLRRGDVVVAVREMALVITPRSDGEAAGSLNRTVVDQGQSRFIQVAFVNLKDQPIVMKMQRENATVGKILESLGQSAALAGSVRVVTPGNELDSAAAEQPLPSESVLLFDRSVLQLSQIPPLPTAIANDRPPAVQTMPVAHSVSTPVAPSLKQDEQVAAAESGEQLEAEVPLPPPLDLDPLEVGDNEIKTAMMTPQQSAPFVDEASAQVPGSMRQLPEFHLADDLLEPPVETAAEGTGAAGWVIVLLTIAGGAAVGWRVVRRRNCDAKWIPAAANVEAADDVEPIDLNEIMDDRLPVIEEPTAGSKRQLQFSLMAGKTSLRADARHETPQPHISPESIVPAREKTVAATQSGIGQLRFDSAHDGDEVRRAPARRPAVAGGSAGLLDRVLSRVQEGGNR